MGKFLDRALNSVLGDVEEQVRRDVERVTREARSSMPRGSLANSITSETRNGVTVRYGRGVMHVPSSVEFEPRVDRRPGMLEIPIMVDPDLLKDGWNDDGGFTSTLKRMVRDAAELDVEKELHIRRHHRCGGYHEEPVTISTGETVAWICRNCTYVRYAEGW